MDCGKARRILCSLEGPRSLDPQIEAAERHVATCPACRQFSSDMQKVSRALGPLREETKAPSRVREQVFQRVAGERMATSEWKPKRRQLPWVVGTALLVAGLILSGVMMLGKEGARNKASSEADPVGLVARHFGGVTYGGSFQTDSPQRAESWLAARSAFVTQVPALPDAQLTEVRQLLLKGRKVVAFRYTGEAGPFGYYILAPEQNEASGNLIERFRLARNHGFRAVSWRHKGLTHVLVGNLPERELLRMAHLCADEMV